MFPFENRLSSSYMKNCSVLSIILLIILISCKKTESPEKIFRTDFEKLQTGKLTDRQTRKIWPDARLICGKKDFIFYKLGVTPHPFFIAEENGNRCLKTLIPKNHYGPVTGSQWKIPLLPRDESFLSYRVKFEKEFDFVKGGKLPGLAGGTANTGGQVPTGYDGWSARLMFWEEGKLSFYLYHPGQSVKWGERLYFKSSNNDTLQISKGDWHLIRQRIKMNTPGKHDGIIQAWIDVQEVFYSDTILFRKTNTFGIDQILFNVFMGGDDLSWAPKKNEYIYFDDICISSQSIYH